jgi:uncharacterized protein (DUF1778 family)
MTKTKGRPHRLTFRFSDEERRAIQKAVKRLGIQSSTWVRSVIGQAAESVNSNIPPQHGDA